MIPKYAVTVGVNFQCNQSDYISSKTWICKTSLEKRERDREIDKKHRETEADNFQKYRRDTGDQNRKKR